MKKKLAISFICFLAYFTVFNFYLNSRFQNIDNHIQNLETQNNTQALDNRLLQNNWVMNHENQTLNSIVLVQSQITQNGETGIAMGTAIWIKPGYLVTAYHVINGGTGIELSNKDMPVILHASVFASDPVFDIAILKVDDKDMDKISLFNPSYLPWGASQAQQWGEPVWVLGNPMGITDTLSKGILSSSERIIQSVNPLCTYIQTDASINEGNSGGEVLNDNGEIIGLVDFINKNSPGEAGGSIGLNFAISSDVVVDDITKMLNNQPVVHPWIGLDIQWAGNKTLIIPDPAGPAEKAGVQPIDDLVSINGVTIDNIQEFIAFQNNLEIGQTVTLKIIRLLDSNGNLLSVPEHITLTVPVVNAKPFDID